MTIRFTKMHGLGNDFVVIDAINQKFDPRPEQIRDLADRHFGIGFDQMLLVEAARSAEADFRYRIFNADGGEVAQCGNGARCFARFVREKQLSRNQTLRVETDSGLLVLEFDGDRVRVNMGIPLHRPEQIPMTAESESAGYTLRVENMEYRFGALSIGNPHAVLTVPDIDNTEVKVAGPAIQNSGLFPQGVNVGFMQIIDPHKIRLRVFERGSGETLACGSGACAAAVTGIEQQCLQSPVQVDLTGGTLIINWPGRGQPVLMTGPAVSVFEGSFSS